MIKNSFLFVVFLLFSICIQTAFAQKTISLDREKINIASVRLDSLVKSKTNKNTPGYAVMVINDGKIIYNKGFGLANLETKQPITSNTDFYLASLSKEFTSMAIMILHDRHLLKFDDLMIKYLPGFPAYGKKITIRNLLTHTSGLPDFYNVLGYNHDFTGLTNQDVWNLLMKQDSLLFPPGTKYNYSNSEYVLLAMIIAKVSQEHFAKFMEENIFNPIGMNNTLIFTDSTLNVPDRAIGYVKDSIGIYKKDDYAQFTTGAGGMYSSTGDLFKWDQSLYTNKLVSKATLQQAFTKQKLNDGTKINYGFGWMINNLNEGNLKGVKYIYHTGSLDGFKNLIVRIPSYHFTCIVLSNSGKPIADPKVIPELFLEK